MHPEGHPHACENCATPLQGEYCHHCGQHVHNPVRSFGHAVEEVFESFWHLDGRIFRTLRRLLAPGRLAQDYLAGRRVPYVQPMRLFVVLCVLTFFVGRLVVHFGSDAVDVRAGGRPIAQARTVEEVERLRGGQVASLRQARAALPAPLEQATEGLEQTLEAVHAQADARIRDPGGTPPPRPQATATDADAAPAAPPAEDWGARLGRRIERNAARLEQDPELLKNAFLGSVPTALFLLVPLFALLLKLVYLGSGRLYLEHLVVALYSHAFLCLALLGQMLLAALSDWRGGRLAVLDWTLDLLMLALWLWMPAYLLLMQKRVYAEGWIATLARFTVLGGVYATVLGLAAVALLLVSLVRI